MQNEAHKRVSIIGCGWLGLPLARYLLAGGSTLVKGSTTSPDKLQSLRDAGIEAYVVSLNPGPLGEEWPALLSVDSLIVDIPPRSSRQGEDFHPQQIRHLSDLIKQSPVSEIVYISSTSVYPELNREVREEEVVRADQSAAPHLVEAEGILTGLRETGRKVTVLRCGGLMGYDRIPGKYVRGKQGLTTGHIPVNYVHRDDVVALISLLLAKGIPDETLNVVAPLHPIRRKVYEASCEEFGWEVPTFSGSETTESFKIVASDKITRLLNYTFLYADPLSFYYKLE